MTYTHIYVHRYLDTYSYVFFSLSDSQICGGSGGYFQSIHGDSIMKSYGGCGGHFQAIRVNLTTLICGSCGGLLGLTSTHTHIYIIWS